MRRCASSPAMPVLDAFYADHRREDRHVLRRRGPRRGVQADRQEGAQKHQPPGRGEVRRACRAHRLAVHPGPAASDPDRRRDRAGRPRRRRGVRGQLPDRRAAPAPVPVLRRGTSRTGSSAWAASGGAATSCCCTATARTRSSCRWRPARPRSRRTRSPSRTSTTASGPSTANAGCRPSATSSWAGRRSTGGPSSSAIDPVLLKPNQLDDYARWRTRSLPRPTKSRSAASALRRCSYFAVAPQPERPPGIHHGHGIVASNALGRLSVRAALDQSPGPGRPTLRCSTHGGRILDCQGRRAGAGGVLREAAPGTVTHSLSTRFCQHTNTSRPPGPRPRAMWRTRPWVAEQHHSEAADGDVETSRCESMRLRVGVLEADVAQAILSGTLSGPPLQGSEMSTPSTWRRPRRGLPRKLSIRYRSRCRAHDRCVPLPPRRGRGR